MIGRDAQILLKPATAGRGLAVTKPLGAERFTAPVFTPTIRSQVVGRLIDDRRDWSSRRLTAGQASTQQR